MKRKRILKIMLILFVAGIVGGGVGVYYVFNMPERNIAREEVTLVTTANELYAMFSTNENVTYQRLGNKVLEVSGKVVEKTQSNNAVTVVLGDSVEGISCSFDSAYVANNNNLLNSLHEGIQVKIKGKCDGYDMIMGVVLTKCLVID